MQLANTHTWERDRESGVYMVTSHGSRFKGLVLRRFSSPINTWARGSPQPSTSKPYLLSTQASLLRTLFNVMDSIKQALYPSQITASCLPKAWRNKKEWFIDCEVRFLVFLWVLPNQLCLSKMNFWLGLS